jgi:hypothetical protein
VNLQGIEMNCFEKFWESWPRSIRKGAKSTCKKKWDKLNLDLQVETILAHVNYMKTTDAWKKSDGAFIPAPLVYINQMRWDGAEVPEVTVNVSINFKDPALEKIEKDSEKAAPMPENVRQKLRDLTKALKSA